MFLDTNVYKGERFQKAAVLDVHTHFKLTETFQYKHFSPYHPLRVKRGFIKGEALRLLRTHSSKTLFEEMIKNYNKTIPREWLLRKFYTKYTLRSKL